VTVAPVQAAPSLSTPTLKPTKPTHNKTFTISGRIGSADLASGRITLTIKKKSGKVYKKYSTVKATLAAGALTYSVKVKITKAGSYEVQASHVADTWHVAGVSLWKTFTVK